MKPSNAGASPFKSLRFDEAVPVDHSAQSPRGEAAPETRKSIRQVTQQFMALSRPRQPSCSDGTASDNVSTSQNSEKTPQASPVKSVEAMRSPCQNKSFDRIYKTLEVMGASSKKLASGNDSVMLFEEGRSMIWKLKSVDDPPPAECARQLAAAQKKWDKSGALRNSGKPRPTPETFTPETKGLINLDIELHFGGGIHSLGETDEGSYVKVKGWFLTGDGQRQEADTRVGRYGEFLPTETYHHQKTDFARVGQIRQQRGSSHPARKPAIATSEPRPVPLSKQLLAMIILNPEIVQEDLTKQYIDTLYMQQQAAYENPSNSNSEKFSSRSAFDGLVRALNALKRDPDA